MKNPFISYSDTEKTEYLSGSCSLNRAVIARLPVEGIEDDIVGKKAVDLFSSALIAEDISQHCKRMGIDVSMYSHRNLPRLLSDGLTSDDVLRRHVAATLAQKYGNRLGLLLLMLRLGQPENKAARPDWTDEHWSYWAQLSTVILTGGLASGILGRHFKEQIQYVFDMAGVAPYNIMLFENGAHAAALGCAGLLRESDITASVLDCGQTNIKRCIVRKRRGDICDVSPLESLPSVNMELVFDSSEDNYNSALTLHRYLLNVIYDTCKLTESSSNTPGDIVISIANYTVGGTLNRERGGYAKLSLLGGNYARILSDELSGRLHRTVNVRLVHDGTAVALNFSDYENAVCLTLGTAIGVGFPDIVL